jgi:hypothetical protein
MTLYDPTIPTDLPPPNIAVDLIRANFSQYAQVFDNNHVALNATNQGKHTHVILQRQLSDPLVDGSFDTLYGKSVATTSSTSDEVFSRIPQFLPVDKPNDPTQLTFNVVNTTGVPFYQSFLPGGYIIYFGTIPSALFINTTITLVPTPSKILCVIPNPTQLVTVGPLTFPVNVAVRILNASQFTIFSQTGVGLTGDIKWLAIAKQ